MQMLFKRPRIVVAALKGGGGKTILSLGLIAAWKETGCQVAPFKKGPDFIDAGWLAFGAGRHCYNLDPFLMEKTQILASFLSHSKAAELSVIEGNRGIFDGLNVEGRCSTAELAKLIRAPLLLVVDVAMATRTLAAMVKGCQVFDPDLDIAGVILNRVAGKRQETLIRAAVEKYCAIPVVGAVPRVKQDIFPERHMGLVPHQEREHARQAVDRTRRMVRQNIELDRILNIAQGAEEIQGPAEAAEPQQALQVSKTDLRIGFIHDKSFWFYYPENLEALERLGAALVELDALENATLPQLDALYIGGGFPEVQARALSENRSFRNSLRAEIEAGLPVYAECGGFMYLGENLVVGGRKYPMVGALPVDFGLQSRPQGHGYTVLEVTQPNLYYAPGESIRGHEFHYSEARLTEQADLRFIFKVLRGHGVDGERDGLCRKSLLATYTHIHAAGTPGWAKNILRAAADGSRKSNSFLKE